MEVIGYADETPTELIIDWIERTLQEEKYLPLVIK